MLLVCSSVIVFLHFAVANEYYVAVEQCATKDWLECWPNVVEENMFSRHLHNRGSSKSNTGHYRILLIHLLPSYATWLRSSEGHCLKRLPHLESGLPELNRSLRHRAGHDGYFDPQGPRKGSCNT